jgi:hypothetical protein
MCPKFVKTHIRASLILKKVPGLLPRNTVKNRRNLWGRREGKTVKEREAQSMRGDRRRK